MTYECEQSALAAQIVAVTGSEPWTAKEFDQRHRLIRIARPRAELDPRDRDGRGESIAESVRDQPQQFTEDSCWLDTIPPDGSGILDILQQNGSPPKPIQH
jgi:hypothetical protein